MAGAAVMQTPNSMRRCLTIMCTCCAAVTEPRVAARRRAPTPVPGTGISAALVPAARDCLIDQIANRTRGPNVSSGLAVRLSWEERMITAVDMFNKLALSLGTGDVGA